MAARQSRIMSSIKRLIPTCTRIAPDQIQVSGFEQTSRQETRNGFASIGSKSRLPARFATLARVSAAIVATAATESTATAASAAFHLRPSFIYGQCTSADFSTTQAFNCSRSFTVIRHFHESESTRAAGIAIGHHGNAIHCSKRCEQIAQISFSCSKREITDVEFLHRISFRIP